MSEGIPAGCPAAGTPIPNYGVNINSSTGLFSGYTWSENIGWISFAPAGPYPASPNYSACLDFSGAGQVCDGLGTNKAGGWARALSYGGGWDGWIKLRGSNYGIDFTPQSGELSGYAWSNMVMGWISFKGVSYVVTTKAKLPPSVSTAGETWSYCTDSLHPTLNWNYSDGTQASYQIQINEGSANFNNPTFDTGEISSSSQSYATTQSFKWNVKYYWQVRAKNQQGDWSNWSNTDNFNTPKHAYPKPDFTWSPSKPAVNETVQFIDQSTAYGGATIQNWKWIFQDGNPSDSTLQNPQTKFTSGGSKSVTLGVKDSDGYDCGITNPADAGVKTVIIAPKVKWREILPW